MVRLGDTHRTAERALPLGGELTSDRDHGFIHRGVELIHTSTELNDTLAGLVRLAAEASDSKMGSLFLLDTSRGVLRPAVTFGLPKEYVEGCDGLPLGAPVCGWVVQNRKPDWVEDMLVDPNFAAYKGLAERTGVRAGFSVPVIDSDGECFGALASHFEKPFRPTSYHIERNKIFATLIAFAIQRQKLLGASGQESKAAAD